MSWRRGKVAAATLVFTLAALAVGPGCSAEEQGAAGAKGQKALRLTIYDKGSALVEETRRMSLPSEGSLAWRGVPKTLDATSIQLEGPKGLKVMEERFRYDPPTQARLLKEARGKKVFLVETIKDTGEERRTEAVLLDADGPPVFKIGDELHLGHPGRVVLPRTPEGLALEPEVVWKVEAAPGEADLTLRYLAGGLGWRADYVLTVEEETLAGALSGAFSLENSSGTDFLGAQVELVAGSLRRAPEVRAFKMAAGMAASAEAVRFEEAAAADLHRYSVEGPVTLADGETLRMAFLQAGGLKVGRRYEVRGGWVGVGAARTGEDKLPVAVVWLVDNTAEAGLGKPLPAGLVRVYVAQADKPLLLAGEVSLAHTPADTKEVKLETGEAFDLVAKRRQTEYTRITKELEESSWLVELENKKSSQAVVRLVEQIPAQAELLKASHPYERRSAGELVFDVKVPAGGSSEVAYSIRVKH